MPPKKKSRVPTTTDASDAPAPSTPGPIPSSAPTTITEPVFSDGWTDEQEITLFKAIAVYRWKPAGMHKHFRMLSITQLMRNHGVFDAHTSPPGIWAKLHTLYNLEGLDEREDLPDDEVDGVSPGFTDFRLPEEDFGEMMAARRLNPEGTASPSHGASVRRRFSESVKGGKGGGKAAAREGSLGRSEVGAGSEDDESVARSSPVSQKSAPRKRAAGVGASRLSIVRGAPPATPRGGARASARAGAVGSTKKTPTGSARRKVKVQQEQESSEEEDDPSGSEEESSEEEGSGSGSGSEGPSGSTQEEEDGESEDEDREEEEEDEDEEGGEGGEEGGEDQEKEDNGSPEVATPRGGAAGGRRSGRGGGAAGTVKTPAKRGGRKIVDSSVRRSARKK